MNKSLAYGIIFILVFAVIGLSLMLLQNQKTIEDQRILIANQKSRITELEAEVEKLSARPVENILNQAGQIIKDKGIEIIKDQLSR